MTSPRPPRLPRARSRSARRTRAHSVMTWRARRRRTGSPSALRSPRSQRPRGRPRICAARSHSARRVAYGVEVNRRGASLCTTTKAASSGTGTGRSSSVAKSMCSACPSVPAAMASGSSRPTARRRCARPPGRRAPSARGSSSCPSASRVATAKAALDDSPAPTGSVLVTRRAPPELGGRSRRSPAARRASSGTGAAPPKGISNGGGNWSESTPTRKLPGLGVKVTSVARPMAMGSERPPL